MSGRGLKLLAAEGPGVLSVLIGDNMDEGSTVSQAPESTVIATISHPEAGAVLINCKPPDVAIEVAVAAT